eukprot:6177626-Pleurochrysis_carterae.AAC.2
MRTRRDAKILKYVSSKLKASGAWILRSSPVGAKGHASTQSQSSLLQNGHDPVVRSVHGQCLITEARFSRDSRDNPRNWEIGVAIHKSGFPVANGRVSRFQKAPCHTLVRSLPSFDATLAGITGTLNRRSCDVSPSVDAGPKRRAQRSSRNNS